MIKLSNWNTIWIYYIFFKNGIFKIGILNIINRDITTQGFASFERLTNGLSKFFAFYILDNKLFFQAGKLKWEITNGDFNANFSFQCKNKIISKFELFKNKQLLFSCCYFHPIRTLVKSIDPTYDEFDFEHDHFLFYISNNIHNTEWIKGHLKNI